MQNSSFEIAEVLNPDSTFPVLMFCEHAGNKLPPEVPPYLGMDNEFLDSYHGYDIGIPHVARQVAYSLGATCILGVYSRLLVDLNRHLEAPDLIHDHDDGIIIPGNQNLTEKDLEHRLSTYYQPFHEICAFHASRLEKIYKKPVIFSFHSFPRHQVGYEEPFPWNFTIHHNESYGVADVFKTFFATKYPDVLVGDNAPYNLKELKTGGPFIHGEKKGLPNILIEIPNDQMLSSDDVTHWSKVCTEALLTLVEKTGLPG